MMILSPNDHSEIAKAISGILQEQNNGNSARLEKLAKHALSIREILGVTIAFGIAIATAAVTLHELRAKPTQEEVQAEIQSVTLPLREQSDRMVDSVHAIEEDLLRVRDVQSFQIEHSAWQGDVLDHVANKKIGKPPEKPTSLKIKERDLLSK